MSIDIQGTIRLLSNEDPTNFLSAQDSQLIKNTLAHPTISRESKEFRLLETYNIVDGLFTQEPNDLFIEVVNPRPDINKICETSYQLIKFAKVNYDHFYSSVDQRYYVLLRTFLLQTLSKLYDYIFNSFKNNIKDNYDPILDLAMEYINVNVLLNPKQMPSLKCSTYLFYMIFVSNINSDPVNRLTQVYNQFKSQFMSKDHYEWLIDIESKTQMRFMPIFAEKASHFNCINNFFNDILRQQTTHYYLLDVQWNYYLKIIRLSGHEQQITQIQTQVYSIIEDEQSELQNYINLDLQFFDFYQLLRLEVIRNEQQKKFLEHWLMKLDQWVFNNKANISLQLRIANLISQDKLDQQFIRLYLYTLENFVKGLKQDTLQVPKDIKEQQANFQQLILFGLQKLYCKPDIIKFLIEYLSIPQQIDLNPFIKRLLVMNSDEIIKVYVDYIKNLNNDIYYRKINKDILIYLYQHHLNIYYIALGQLVKSSCLSDLSIIKFIDLVFEMMYYNLDQLNNEQALLFTKILTLASMDKFDQFRRVNMQYKNDLLPILLEKLISYDTYIYDLNREGTPLLDYVIKRQHEIQDKLSALFNRIDGGLIAQKIFHEIMYFLYLLYWNLPNRGNLQIIQVQNEGLQLFKEIYRFSMCLFCDISRNMDVTQRVYDFINPCLIVACGQKYFDQIYPITQQNSFEEMKISLDSIRELRILNITIVYNKYFELAYALLFESCIDQIGQLDKSKSLLLKFLEDIIEQKIELIQRFKEILPKFMFYVRIERNQDHIDVNEENNYQDPSFELRQFQFKNCKIILFYDFVQLFETLSVHSSVLLKLDIAEQNDDLEKAYQMANIPIYTIPIYSEQQQLIKYVDNKECYNCVLLNVLDIIYDTLKNIKQNNQFRRLYDQRSLHFQGDGSQIQIQHLQLDNNFILTLKFKYIQQQVDEQDIVDLLEFVQNYEQTHLITLNGLVDQLVINLGRNKSEQCIFIRTKLGHVSNIYQELLPLELQNQWVQLTVFNHNGQIIVTINEHNISNKMNQDLMPKHKLFEFKELTIVFGSDEIEQKKEDFDSQRSLSFSQSFLNLQLQKENFFFTGQLSELQIYQYDDKISQIILSEQYQELRKHRELLLLELDLNSDTKLNTFTLKEYFINSQFSLELNEAQIFRYKKKITKKAIFKRQNIYLIDINSFKDLIVKNGNLILFYMIIDLFNIIEMNKKYNQIYDQIVVTVLNIISTLLEFEGQTIQDLFKGNAQAFFYIISKYINRVEKVSEVFFQSLMEIIKITKESTLTFQLLKLTLNQYLEFEQINQIFELITKSIGSNLKELLDTARSINNYQHREGISHISMLIGNCLLQEFDIRIKGTAGFISHSYDSDLRTQIEFDFVKYPTNANSIDEVFNFMTTVYLNEPNLQFLDILQIISLVFEIIEEKKVTKFKRSKQDLDKLFKLFSNGAGFCRMFQDQFKYTDRYFELMFNIMVLISRNLGIKMDFPSFIQIMMKLQLSSGIVMISEKMIQCIVKYFDLFQAEQQRESLQCLLSLVHCIYQIQICDESSKQIIINYFNDQTKGFLRKNLRKWEFLDLLSTFDKVGQMLDYMIPIQINEKQNTKTKIYELYADILTYMFENRDVAIFAYAKNQEPNLSDFPITTNKITFQIYLQIIQGYATLLKTEFDGQSGGQAYFNDRLKDREILIKFINLINFTLHLDQLILQEKFDHIRWDYFANVLEKIIDLFYSMGLLFSTIEPIPCIKGVPQIWVCKNESGRLIPNGGIARLMLSLILSTMTFFDIVPIFEKYMDYFKHFLLKRSKEKETNQSYHNPYPQLFTNFTSLMQNIDFRLQSVGIQKNGQNDEQLKDLFIHKILGIIVYKLLSLKSYPEDYSTIIQKFISIMERKIPNIFERLNQNVLNNYHLSNSFIDKQQLDPIKDVGQILECFKSAQEHEKGKKPKQDPKQRADIKAVLLGQSYDYDWILRIMYQFFYLPYDLIERLWVMSANEKIQRQSMSIGSGSDHQLSLFSNTRGESRTFSLQSIQENRKQARSSDEENWQQVSVEVKMKNSLWYFLDESLQPLYQMLDNFLITRQFDFVIMGQIQNKFMIRPLEDSIRRRQQLTPIKLINKNKPYQIPSQSKVDFSLKKINDSQQPSNLSPSLYSQSESLSSSLNFGSSRKESSQSRLNAVISTQKLSFRKDSSESQMENDTTKCYDCFVVMPDGGIFGSICVRQEFIQFQSKNMGNLDNIFKCPEVNIPESQLTLTIKFKDITQIQSRRYLLQEIAFEIFTQYSNYFFNLLDTQKVRQFLTSCQQKNIKVVVDRRHEFTNQKFVQRWQAGQISNFHYLMLLNTYSGRSYNDIGQYFIFPWVVIDFKAINFDPQNNNPRQFRSLNSPIGTIEPSRIATTQQRFEQRDRNNLDEYVQHGSHYSNSTIVMNYLIRLEPFNELHYKLQRNRFDIADRLFSSIQLLWENTKWQDCKELIPEFYHMPEFLQNINCFDFGRMQSNIQVADVDMPQWVRTRTAEEFVYLMRAALECDFVSLNLNEWIDLTFGEKQYGKKAEDSFNLYHHLSYEQNFNLKQLKSTQSDEIQSRIAQIQYFGQTPSQMFDKQHEKRKKNKYMYVRRKPLIKYKHCVYYDQKNAQKAKEIIAIYFFQEKKVYLLTQDFELQSIDLKETLKYICCTNGRFQNSKSLKKFNNIQTQFNSHNLFSFIQQSADHFFDNVDSQYHVNLNDSQDTDLYFVIGGFLEGEFEFYNLTQQKSGQKVTHHKKYITCLKYHAYQKLLVVGSIDSIVSVWRLKFKNKEMENLKEPEFQIMAHKNSITCLDIHDIYILSVDLNQTAYLHTISGETIHQIQLSTEFYISQCIIHPAQFLIFKTKKTVLNVYTFNASCYINNYDLNMENTYNMYFFTPFSTIFFIAQEDSDQIIVQDLFEIKHNQQNYRPMDTLRSSVLINSLKPEKSERIQQDVGVKEPALVDNHVSCFCFCFNDYKLDSNVNYQFYYQIFCSTNGQIYWLQDENQKKEPILQYEFGNMGLGSKFQI